MKQKTSNIIVISLCGSIVVPEDVDVEFLKKFKALIEKRIKNNNERFVIIVGGGRIARKYVAAANQITQLTLEESDLIGIETTKLNAYLIKSIFKNHSYKDVITNPTKKLNFKEKILIAAGWKPGCSTDYDAVLIAKNLNAKTIINLSNIDYVYTRDPKLFSDAKKIEKTNWKEFRKLVGDKWDPGLNAPFDPVASKECEKSNIKVIILNGRNLENLESYMDGNKFIGTKIE